MDKIFRQGRQIYTWKKKLRRYLWLFSVATTIKHGKEKAHSEQLQNVGCTATVNHGNKEGYDQWVYETNTTDAGGLHTLWWLLHPVLDTVVDSKTTSSMKKAGSG